MINGKLKILTFKIIIFFLIFWTLSNTCIASDGGGMYFPSREKLPEAPKLQTEQQEVPEKISELLEADKKGIQPKDELKEKPEDLLKSEPLPEKNGFKNRFLKMLSSLFKILILIAITVFVYLLIKNYKQKPKPEQTKEIAEPETISEAVTTYVKHKLE